MIQLLHTTKITTRSITSTAEERSTPIRCTKRSIGRIRHPCRPTAAVLDPHQSGGTSPVPMALESRSSKRVNLPRCHRETATCIIRWSVAVVGLRDIEAPPPPAATMKSCRRPVRNDARYRLSCTRMWWSERATTRSWLHSTIWWNRWEVNELLLTLKMESEDLIFSVFLQHNSDMTIWRPTWVTLWPLSLTITTPTGPVLNFWFIHRWTALLRSIVRTKVKSMAMDLQFHSHVIVSIVEMYWQCIGHYLKRHYTECFCLVLRVFIFSQITWSKQLLLIFQLGMHFCNARGHLRSRRVVAG